MSPPRSSPKTRFGCQNCRLRHLKCDELRPSCARCQKAGLQCNREHNIKFKHGANPSVKPTGSGRLEFDFRKSQPWVKTAPSLVFLDGTRQLQYSYDRDKRHEDLAASSSTSKAVPCPNTEKNFPGYKHSSSLQPTLERASSAGHMKTGILQMRDRQLRSADTDSHEVPMSSPTSQDSHESPFESWHYSPHSDGTTSLNDRLAASPSNIPSASNIVANYLSLDSQLEVIEVSAPNGSYAVDANSSQSPSGIYLDASVWPLSSKEEAGLLRYYVERLARDFDLSDPDRHFRNVVPQRAATCPLLLNAIYALSARHLSRVGNYDPLISNQYHQECLERVIPVLNDSAAILDENLLASTIILRHLEEIEVPLSGYSPPDRQSHLLGSYAFMKAQRHAAVSVGLRQAAFWVGLRQEIYVAFVNQRSITIALEDSIINRSCEAAADYIWSRRMVALCADVICFCFGEDDKLTTAYDRLSDSVEQWHSSKNHSFTPFYYKEAEEDSVFPEIWFLNDEVILGWQHYYITKLLLCAHNPRVPRLGPGRASALRAMDEEIKDYVRVLCGIAISNPDTAPNFTYASMAVVAAGDKFTEPHEQEALLLVLNICDSQYAFPTAHARENLKAAWGWAQETT